MKKQKGFTIIEILISVGITGIVLVAVVFIMATTVKRADDAVGNTNINKNYAVTIVSPTGATITAGDQICDATQTCHFELTGSTMLAITYSGAGTGVCGISNGEPTIQVTSSDDGSTFTGVCLTPPTADTITMSGASGALSIDATNLAFSGRISARLEVLDSLDVVTYDTGEVQIPIQLISPYTGPIPIYEPLANPACTANIDNQNFRVTVYIRGNNFSGAATQTFTINANTACGDAGYPTI